MLISPVHRAFQLAGTAILSKLKPLSIDKTLPGHPDPNYVKGRIVTLEFEDYYVIGTYVVNAGQGLKVCLFANTKRPC
jgi:AP endonuclease-1